MINYDPGSFMSLGGKKYALKQFRSHRTSQEKMNGKVYEMVPHPVRGDQEVCRRRSPFQKGEDKPFGAQIRAITPTIE